MKTPAATPQTPLQSCPELAQALGLTGLFLKREDLHPYGSHKGRSIPVMIDMYAGKGDKRFAITGSGNAALAAALHIKKLNSDGGSGIENGPFELDIYIGQHANPNKVAKVQKLADDHIKIYTKERPLQALSQAVDEGVRSLRQSTDDEALVGYSSLADELIAASKVGAVFMATSSGTTAQALAQDFLNKKAPIQMHIVQTSSNHVLSDAFETYDGPDEKSTADAIVDQLGYRKVALTPLIQKTGGNGWVATNEDIARAQELILEHTGLDLSPNGALSVAGAMLAAYRGAEFNGAVVCVVGGI